MGTTSGNVPLENTIKRQVCGEWYQYKGREPKKQNWMTRTLPQAPSPTMTSFLRISDIYWREKERKDIVRVEVLALG